MINYSKGSPVGGGIEQGRTTPQPSTAEVGDDQAESSAQEETDFQHITDFLDTLDKDEIEYLKEQLISRAGESEDGEQMVPFDDSEEAALRESPRTTKATEMP